MKLDCEGGEYPGVLEATRLPACQEIVVECHPLTVGGRQMSYTDISHKLVASGFEITACTPDKLNRNHTLWARNKSL